MNSKSERPSADADIDALHAWAASGSKGAAPARAATSFSVPAADRRPETARSGVRGGSLLPKVLLVVGAGLAAYLVFSFIIGLLMTLLMIAGGVALLYAVYRVGRRQGRDRG